MPGNMAAGVERHWLLYTGHRAASIGEKRTLLEQSNYMFSYLLTDHSGVLSLNISLLSLESRLVTEITQ